MTVLVVRAFAKEFAPATKTATDRSVVDGKWTTNRATTANVFQLGTGASGISAPALLSTRRAKNTAKRKTNYYRTACANIRRYCYTENRENAVKRPSIQKSVAFLSRAAYGRELPSLTCSSLLPMRAFQRVGYSLHTRAGTSNGRRFMSLSQGYDFLRFFLLFANDLSVSFFITLVSLF